jgi:hypothetical protein
LDELSFTGGSPSFAPDFMDGFSLLRAAGVAFTVVVPTITLVSIAIYPETSAPIYQFMLSLATATTLIASGFSTLILSLLEIIW